MNWEVISQYLPLYQKAMWLTLRIGWMGIAFSIIIGLFCALIVHYKIPVARQIVKIYIELFRNTPLLVQLFFIYFGLPKVGLSISADVCGVAGLALLGGSYMAETFRSGLESVDAIQSESAYSLGMSAGQVMRYVILPQAIKSVLPSLVNEFISLLKNTTLIASIGLVDILSVGQRIQARTYRAFEPFFAIAVFYYALVLGLSFLGKALEKKVNASDRG